MLEILPFTPASDALFVVSEGSLQKEIALTGVAADTLRTDAVEALHSLPRRGLEIGGILIGRDGESFEIGSLAPVNSEHLFGPRYEQSERDRVVFQARLDELRQAPAGGGVPVGLYRTFTQEGGAVDEHDVENLRLYFPDRDALFLLVAPKPTGRTGVSCFYWNGQNLVPCDVKETPIIKPAAAVSATPESAELERKPVASPESLRPRSHSISKSVRWLNEFALAGIAALIVFAVVSFLHRDPEGAPAKPASSTAAAGALGTRVESKGDGAQIVWNEKSDVVKNAVGALLSVEDRGTKTDIPISLSELQTGTFFFGPAGPHATFAFIVYSADGDDVQENATARAVPPAAVRKQAKVVRDRGPERAVRNRTPTLPPPVTSSSGSILSKP